MISMPSHQTSQPRPQAPSVGLSQSSSTKRISWASGSMPDRSEALEIEILQILRRRLEDHLELVVVLQAIGVLAVTAVGRPARGLDIGRAPWLGAERAQRRGGMEGAGADLDVVGLQEDAALLGPEALQDQDQFLKARRAMRAHRNSIPERTGADNSMALESVKDGGRASAPAPGRRSGSLPRDRSRRRSGGIPRARSFLRADRCGRSVARRPGPGGARCSLPIMAKPRHTATITRMVNRSLVRVRPSTMRSAFQK